MKKLILILCLTTLAFTTALYADSANETSMPADARFTKALHYLLGSQGEKKSPDRAFDMFRKLAEEDFAAAQHMVATLYEKGNGVDQDLTQAWLWYQRAANNGFASSANRLLRVEKRMSEAQRQLAQQQLAAQSL